MQYLFMICNEMLFRKKKIVLKGLHICSQMVFRKKNKSRRDLMLVAKRYSAKRMPLGIPYR